MRSLSFLVSLLFLCGCSVVDGIRCWVTRGGGEEPEERTCDTDMTMCFYGYSSQDDVSNWRMSCGNEDMKARIEGETETGDWSKTLYTCKSDMCNLPGTPSGTIVIVLCFVIFLLILLALLGGTALLYFTGKLKIIPKEESKNANENRKEKRSRGEDKVKYHKIGSK